MDSHTLARLGDYADGQYGQVTAVQVDMAGADLAELTAAGFVEPVVDGVRRLRAGGHHTHPRLYASWLLLVPAVPAWERDLPSSGVVSHGAALRLYGAGDEAGDETEFIVADSEPTPGVRVSAVGDGDWQPLHGLPVTTPARTLVDVADRVDVDELARVIGTFIKAGYASRAPLQGDVPVHLKRIPAKHGIVLLELLDVSFE